MIKIYKTVAQVSALRGSKPNEAETGGLRWTIYLPFPLDQGSPLLKHLWSKHQAYTVISSTLISDDEARVAKVYGGTLDNILYSIQNLESIAPRRAELEAEIERCRRAGREIFEFYDCV